MAFLAGYILLFVSLACGMGSAAPQAAAPPPSPVLELSVPSGLGAGASTTPTLLAEYKLVIAPTAAAHVAQPSSGPPPAAIPESRRLTLEYPAKIRTGDSDVIRLTLEVDALGNLTPTAEVHGNVITGQVVQVPDLYETHNVIAEAQLDVTGLDIRPSGAISEPLVRGESVNFFWSVHPKQSGTYRGTAWLMLTFVDKATGEQDRKAIAAEPVQIQATSFLGLGGDGARALGAIGSVMGGALGFPFADDLLKWLWSRIRRRH